MTAVDCCATVGNDATVHITSKTAENELACVIAQGGVCVAIDC